MNNDSCFKIYKNRPYDTILDHRRETSNAPFLEKADLGDRDTITW